MTIASFNDLKLEELLTAAETFGVTVDLGEAKGKTRDNLVKSALVENGVSVNLYNATFHPVETVDGADGKPLVRPAPVNQKKVIDPEKSVLLVMERENGTYEIRGYRFTREHPFMLVDEDDADYILEHLEGFRIARPKEAREYYS